MPPGVSLTMCACVCGTDYNITTFHNNCLLNTKQNFHQQQTEKPDKAKEALLAGSIKKHHHISLKQEKHSQLFRDN